MLRLLASFGLVVPGITIGVLVAHFLFPGNSTPSADPDAEANAEEMVSTAPREFVRLENQFVIPIANRDRITAMVVLAITLEVDEGTSAEIFEDEPKLRDAFLASLFDFANTGRFDAQFTNSRNLTQLRSILKEVAERVTEQAVHSVLIQSIARQEVR